MTSLRPHLAPQTLALALMAGLALTARPAAAQVTGNLLTNPGAETGDLSGWTASSASSPTIDDGSFDLGIDPHSGSFDFLGRNNSSGTLTQTVALTGSQGLSAALIDGGASTAVVSFWEQGLNQGNPSDDAQVTLTFFGASGDMLGTFSTPEVDSHGGAWQSYTGSTLIPVGARSADYTMTFLRHVGSDNDSFVDDNSLTLAAAPEPDRAITRLETILEHVSTAINLFRLFEARPGLLDQVLRVVTLAEPLAQSLGRHPEWLDALIDTRALDLPGPAEELAEQMRQAPPDYERRLDRIRAVVGEARFALSVQLVEARHDPLAIAAGLARVAEAALTTGATAATEEFQAVHGRIPGGDLLILGLGRLGGGALTHASDLDVIYLFTGEIGVESDGQRPLTASLYFNRLAQRVTAALSVPTAAGALYEIDTRLRPQGTQGPLAVSLDSFARYQREDAWTWEHMALARARPLFGPPDAQAALQTIIDDVLRQERDPDKLRADVLKMRGEIAANKRPAGPLDAKLQRGGLIDCEFIVHYLQLRERTAFTPDLSRAIGELAGARLLPDSFATHHDLLTRLLVAARLLAPDGQPPPEGAQQVLAAACGVGDFGALLRAVGEARHGVTEAWAETFGETLEERS